MCLFRKKQQIINFSQELLTKSIADNNEVLFIRSENVVKDPNAIIIIPQTHNALVIKGGGDARYYKSGNHRLFDDKSEIRAWKKGIPVEVIYFMKDTRVSISWGTPRPILYRDKVSGKTVNVGASGDACLVIENPEQFYKRIVGFKKEYNIDDFSSRFRSIVSDCFVAEFLGIVDSLNLTYDRFDLQRANVASAMQNKLSLDFAENWGVTVERFTIQAFMVDKKDIAAVEGFTESTIRKKQLGEYLRELERLDNKQWEREKYFRRLEAEDRAAYYELLKVIGTSRKNNTAPKTEDPDNSKAGLVRCWRCRELVSENSVYCPKCGEKILL